MEGTSIRATELNAEFGVSGVLDFAETEHGLVKAAISLGAATGELFLQGAQVTAWRPTDERPVLFTSPNSAFAPGRAIRGGVPIVFPWFGASRHTPTAPQHGFARTAMWHLDKVEAAGGESVTLTLSLGDGDVGSPFWPERFRAIYTVTFGRTLSLRLAVQNRATHPIGVEEALPTSRSPTLLRSRSPASPAPLTSTRPTRAAASRRPRVSSRSRRRPTASTSIRLGSASSRIAAGAAG